jgi:predicted nucleic acid-binding protein
LVIVDTSVWIDFLVGRDIATTAALQRLIDNASAAYTGVVLAELMRGMRTEDERIGLDEELSGALFVEMKESTWRRAGAISGELDAQGQPIALTGIFIAALALDEGHELFTLDTDFERIPGLRLYNWRDSHA